jgi:hypothetical protein
MRTYESALEHYENSRAPKRSEKWKKYGDNPRYLRGVSNWHKGIHKEDATGAIYYRLYNTDIAKFYPPLNDGTRKVEMVYYSSQLTNLFMYDYDLNYYYQTTTEDKQVVVPYVQPSHNDSEPSATLWVTAEGKLILDKSKHKDIYTYRSSAEDKQKRKDFKTKLDTLLTLAMFRLDEYKDHATFKDDYGAPFGTTHKEPVFIEDYRRWVSSAGDAELDVINPHFVNYFLELGQGVMDVLASHRIYNYVPEGDRWAGSLFHTWGKKPEEIDANNLKMREICNAITADEFKKSLTNRVLDISGIKTGTVKTPWGQFKDSIPRRWYS